MNNSVLTNNTKRSLEVGIADSMNFTGIFLLFIKDSFKQFLEEYAKFFMFPFAAAGSCIQAILAIKRAVIKKGEKASVLKAIFEIIAAAAITTAVVGSFVAATLFSLAAPIIFTATLAVKTLYHVSSALIYLGMSLALNNSDDQRKAYKEEAKTNAIASISLCLATVAVAFVMLAAKPVFTILGIAGGIIGSIYATYKRCTLCSLTPKHKEAVLNKHEKETLLPAESKRSCSPPLTPQNSPTSSVSPTRISTSESSKIFTYINTGDGSGQNPHKFYSIANPRKILISNPRNILISNPRNILTDPSKERPLRPIKSL